MTHFTNYILFEKPKGLDFSMRDISESNWKYNGYAMTSYKALKNIFKFIDSKENYNFLDIGSGKGAVLTYANRLGFKTSAGIEYSQHFHKIALRNISILGVSDRVKSFNCLAEDFTNYGFYDIYFFFNPFNEETWHLTIKSICLANEIRSKKKYLCAYRKFDESYFGKYVNGFVLEEQNVCPYRYNSVKIYSLN